MSILAFQARLNCNLTQPDSQRNEGKRAGSGSMLEVDVLGTDSRLNMELLKEKEESRITCKFWS